MDVCCRPPPPVEAEEQRAPSRSRYPRAAAPSIGPKHDPKDPLTSAFGAENETGAGGLVFCRTRFSRAFPRAGARQSGERRLVSRGRGLIDEPDLINRTITTAFCLSCVCVINQTPPEPAIRKKHTLSQITH